MSPGVLYVNENKRSFKKRLLNLHGSDVICVILLPCFLSK